MKLGRHLVKTSIILAALWCLTCGGQEGVASTVASEKAIFLEVEDSPFQVFTVEIPMRDGKHLSGDVYLPSAEGVYPVILIQTPYGKHNVRDGFAEATVDRRGPLFSDTNYAFVVTDWRGRYASKDALTPIRVPNNGADGFDTVQWIAKQAWCNGKIGTWGPSALGGVQFKTAKENPPALVCCVPSVVPLNVGYDVYIPGGVIWAEYTKLMTRLGWDIYDRLTQHPVKDVFWKKLEAATFTKGEDIRVPVLLVGGWYDMFTDGVIEAFKTIHTQGGEKARAHTKLIMGPWVHTGVDLELQGELSYRNAVMFSAKKTIEFYDYWLRGINNGFDKEPPVIYYQMGAEEWRSSEMWPPKSVKDIPYYLHKDRTLLPSMPVADSESTTYEFDPSSPVLTIGGPNLNPTYKNGPCDQRLLSRSLSAEVLAFSTSVLQEDLAISGMVKANLYVASDRRDTDFTAILVDMYPDGRSMLVAEGIQRMRFRNTVEREELMTPGVIYPVTIEIGNTAITFLRGHRVGVMISSSSYPRYDVNLNDGGPMYREDEGLVATNSVYHDVQHPSALVLPVDCR